MKVHVKRRSFLRGIGGITLGLPFLETFAPRKAGAAGFRMSLKLS